MVVVHSSMVCCCKPMARAHWVTKVQPQAHGCKWPSQELKGLDLQYRRNAQGTYVQGQQVVHGEKTSCMAL